MFHRKRSWRFIRLLMGVWGCAIILALSLNGEILLSKCWSQSSEPNLGDSNSSCDSNLEVAESSVDSETNGDRLQDAIDRAHNILRTGVKNYPEHRQCFSCHHQALPLLAFSLQDRRDAQHVPARFLEDPITKSILDFTTVSFDYKADSMRDGVGVGGKALTVGYGLWTMDLAGAPESPTTSAMVEYLLKTQGEDGAWDFQSLRPPASASRAMTTAIAVYGLRSYGMAVKENRTNEWIKKVFVWLKTYDPESHEDLIATLWLTQMSLQLGSSLPMSSEDSTSIFPESMLQNKLDPLARKLWETQREDGGWAQIAELASDPYATGQALVMLQQISPANHLAFEKPEYRKGIEFLLDAQKPDGSWHVTTRAKPVQVYFDNGDPHGKDQFISMMATSWATAALSNYQVKGVAPLDSARLASDESRSHD